MIKIYNDAKEIKIALENDPELILVLEETLRNGEGDTFEDVYDDLECCLHDVFKHKSNSSYTIYLVNETEYYTECDSYDEYVGNIAINSLNNKEIRLIYADYEATKKLPARYIETEGGLVWNLKRNNLDEFNVIIEDYHKRFEKVFETIIPTENAELDDMDIIIGAAAMLKEIDEDDENIFNYLYDEGSWERQKIDEYLKEREEVK